MHRIRPVLIALLALFFLAIPASAQDVHVSYSGSFVPILAGVSFTNYTVGTQNYIFSVSPQSAINFYVTNNTGTSGNITVATNFTGSQSVPSFTGNVAPWVALPTTNIGTGGTSASQALVVSGNSTIVLGTGITNAAQIDVQLSAGSGASNFTFTAVLTPNGILGQTKVQGLCTTGASAAGCNPVLAGISDVNGFLQPFPGAVDGEVMSASTATNISDNASVVDKAWPMRASTAVMAVMDYQVDHSVGAGQSRTHGAEPLGAVSATALGDTAIFTDVGTFHVQCVGFEVTGNASLAAAGIETITMDDNGTAIPGLQWQLFIPAAAGTTGFLFSQPTFCFNTSTGFTASGTGHNFNVKLSVALATGAVNARAFGWL